MYKLEHFIIKQIVNYVIKLYIMNLNQFTFHKANPFYKQDFLPDRAWYNRKSKQYPSELPSGQEYFPQKGRKHFINKFNSSEIQHDDVLKSPQRFPFQNRIAMDKSYMRSLNTIDIEGASSNTRINQSIKNKYKARDQLNRRYNHSVEIRKPELTEQQKRREIAIQKYEEFKSKALHKENSDKDIMNYSRLTSNNPQKSKSPATLKKDLTQQYKRFVMNNSNNKYHKDIPQPDYSHQIGQYGYQNNSYSTISYDHGTKPKQYKYSNQLQNNKTQIQQSNNFRQATSHYNNQFNAQKFKNNEEYRKIVQYEFQKQKIPNKNNDYRKYNPTNLSLSFNLAGQSIVSN